MLLQPRAPLHTSGRACAGPFQRVQGKVPQTPVLISGGADDWTWPEVHFFVNLNVQRPKNSRQFILSTSGGCTRAEAKMKHLVVVVQAALPHQLQAPPQCSSRSVRVAEYDPSYPGVHLHGTKQLRYETKSLEEHLSSVG